MMHIRQSPFIGWTVRGSEGSQLAGFELFSSFFVNLNSVSHGKSCNTNKFDGKRLCKDQTDGETEEQLLFIVDNITSVCSLSGVVMWGIPVRFLLDKNSGSSCNTKGQDSNYLHQKA